MIKFLLLFSLLVPMTVTARESFKALGTTIVLEDSAGAALANGVSDAFTASLTPFDRAIRLDTDKETTEGDYLQLAARSMRNWNTSQAAELRNAFNILENKAHALGLRLPVPDTIYLCNTRAREEFGAEGYTRGTRIMLNGDREKITPGLLAHELWHVVSRFDAVLRDRAYAGFGFRPCNRIDYKPAFQNQVITNPDCPFIEHYIRANTGGQDRDLALVLFSRSPYVKGGGGLGRVDSSIKIV